MIEIIKNRRSVRSFTEQTVEREKVLEMVDCGRLAPSGRNTQPWKFVAITDKDRLQKLSPMLDNGGFLSQAPLCIAVFCEDSRYYLEDGSAATENILLAAESLGLGACWITGDKKPYARQVGDILGAPDNYRLVSLVAVGHPAENPEAKAKKALEDVMYWESFSE